MRNPKHLSPTSAFKIYVNTGPNSFYGEKYKVEKVSQVESDFVLGTDSFPVIQVLEDDGKMVSGSTSVVHDSERKRLFFHGKATNPRFIDD